MTEYAAGATGSVAPIATLTGPATGVQLPNGIALDPARHLSVDNAAGITECPPGANGNVASIAALTGPFMGITASSNIAFDSAGHLFVNATRPGSGFAAEEAVQEYAVGATGDPAPIATLHGADTGLGGPRASGSSPARASNC